MSEPATRLQQLLDDPLLLGVQVVAGQAGIERAVTDVVWLGPGSHQPALAQALCVTGPEHQQPAYLLDALLRRAFDGGAAAVLVVAEHQMLPPSSLRLADRLGLPLLWCAAADLQSLVQGLTVRVRAPEVARARTVIQLHQRLQVLREGSAMVQAVTDLTQIAVALVGSDGSCILGRLETPVDTTTLRAPVAQQLGGSLVHPVHNGSERLGWLVCDAPGTGDARADAQLVLVVLEPYLRAWLAEERRRLEHDTVLEQGVLAEIIADQGLISREAAEAAASIGWRLNGWHVGIHVVRDEDTDGRSDPFSAQRFISVLSEHSITVGALVDRSDHWAVWWSTPSEPSDDEARTLLRRLRVAAAALPARWGLAIGVGQPRPGPGGLAESLADARAAAYLASSRPFRPAVVHSQDLGITRMLLPLQQSESARVLAESILEPIRKADGGVLLETLQVFLENDRAAVVTARELGVHRNTVTLRIQKVVNELGVDLDDASQRLALLLACRTMG